METVGDLARLPRATLERRLGVSNGSNLAALAHGRRSSSRSCPSHDAKSISVSETYERDLTLSDEIDTELIRLCDRLAFRVRRAGLAGRTIGLTVRYSDFVTITRHHTLEPPDRHLAPAVASRQETEGQPSVGTVRSGCSGSAWRRSSIPASPASCRSKANRSGTIWQRRWMRSGTDLARDAVRPARLINPDRES